MRRVPGFLPPTPLPLSNSRERPRATAQGDAEPCGVPWSMPCSRLAPDRCHTPVSPPGRRSTLVLGRVRMFRDTCRGQGQTRGTAQRCSGARCRSEARGICGDAFPALLHRAHLDPALLLSGKDGRGQERAPSRWFLVAFTTLSSSAAGSLYCSGCV